MGDCKKQNTGLGAWESSHPASSPERTLELSSIRVAPGRRTFPSHIPGLPPFSLSSRGTSAVSSTCLPHGPAALPESSDACSRLLPAVGKGQCSLDASALQCLCRTRAGVRSEKGPGGKAQHSTPFSHSLAGRSHYCPTGCRGSKRVGNDHFVVPRNLVTVSPGVHCPVLFLLIGCRGGDAKRVCFSSLAGECQAERGGALQVLPGLQEAISLTPKAPVSRF